MAESERAVASREQIQAALPTTSALLLWVDVQDNSGKVQEHFACVVRSEGEPFWVRLPGTGEQGKWTKDDTALPFKLRAALAAEVSPDNLPELIQQLRRQHIEPVLAHLKKHGITKLFVVGVNWMAGTPVEAIAPEFAISYVPSGTFLARLPKKPTFENTLLAIGDPIYELTKKRLTDSEVASRGELWADLPATRFEVGQIAKLFPSAKVLLDGQASERNIDALRKADELKQFRYLHFATHGKGNNVSAFESKLILSLDQKKESSPSRVSPG